MSQLKVATRENRTHYRPGEEIVGAAGWKLPAAPKSAEVRLFWFTRGKGIEDVEVAATVRFDAPQAEEARPFRFVAPAAPSSFSGRLISLVWALELVLEPGGHSARCELTLAPDGREILIGAAARKGRS
jgi:hypothetical protein